MLPILSNVRNIVGVRHRRSGIPLLTAFIRVTRGDVRLNRLQFAG